jgi:SOS-response transcriptional repressor LexA
MNTPFLAGELTEIKIALAAEPPIGLVRDLVRCHERMLALRVSGDSMAGALAADGDIIILAASADLRDGDLVVARIHDNDGQEVPAIGRLHRQNGHLHLQAGDSDAASVCYRPDQIKIEGRIVLIMRQLG